jgi:alcohol dehydrogenase/propanol-preferring alcohol dehydrogenase
MRSEPGVEGWASATVGIGWNGGYCGRCDRCRRGSSSRASPVPVTGFSHDGGYGEYMIAPVTSLARVPDDLSATDAAPLLCAACDDVQRAAQQRSALGRPRRRARIGGSRSPQACSFAKRRWDPPPSPVARVRRQRAARRIAAPIAISTATVRGSCRGARRAGRRARRAHRDGHRRTRDECDDRRARIEGSLLVLVAAAEDRSRGARVSAERGAPPAYRAAIPESRSDSEDTQNFCVRTGVRSMNRSGSGSSSETKATSAWMSGKARFPLRCAREIMSGPTSLRTAVVPKGRSKDYWRSSGRVNSPVRPFKKHVARFATSPASGSPSRHLFAQAHPHQRVNLEV